MAATTSCSSGGCCSLLTKAVDLVLLSFFAMMVVVIPLLDSQVCLSGVVEFPKALVELTDWYSAEFGDYLVAEKPHFFRGIVWVELLLLWPLSVACTFAILTGKRWFQTASLMAGVSTVTSMAAIMAELLGSGRAPNKLLQMYAPFAVLSILATLRGLFPCSTSARLPERARHAARKKRA